MVQEEVTQCQNQTTTQQNGFQKKLPAFQMNKKRVTMNKEVYFGLLVLDIIKDQDNARLC